jgi:hypothetical protein
VSRHAPLTRLPAPAPCGVTSVSSTWPAGCPATACDVTGASLPSPAGCPADSFGVASPRFPSPAGCPADSFGVASPRFPSPAGCPADSFGVASPRFPHQPVARPTRSAWQSPRRSHQPVARLLRAARRALRCPGRPIARPPCATSRSCPRNPASPVNAGLLDPPGVPRVSPEADPVFSSERFLRPVERATQALSAISSRFFCHPQDIQRLSPVHRISPPDHAQLFHRFLGITTGGSGPASAVHCFMPTMWQPQMRGLLGGSGD